jgi:hypothetical protein
MYARGYYLGKKPAKTQFPDAFYVDHARHKINASRCVANGWLAPEAGALADRAADDMLTNYVYDKQKLSEAWKHESSTFTPSQSDCDQLANFVTKLQEVRRNRP